MDHGQKGAIDISKENIRHNKNFARVTCDTPGWTPGGDFMNGARYHDMVAETIFMASSASLKRAGKHLATLRDFEGEAKAASKARFANSVEAAAVWENMPDIYDNVTAAQRKRQDMGRPPTMGAFECYAKKSTLTLASRAAMGEEPEPAPSVYSASPSKGRSRRSRSSGSVSATQLGEPFGGSSRHGRSRSHAASSRRSEGRSGAFTATR